MRSLAWLTLAAALAACGRADAPATDTTAAAAPAAPRALAASDVAGNWTVKGMNQAGDSTLVTYDLMATGDTTGWVIVFADGQRVPMRGITFSGDSVVMLAGPFNSQLRRGVRVLDVRGVSRMQDGKLVGTVVSRYDTKRPDSVLVLRTEATRKP